jgi:hypothetical protein
MLEPHLQTHLPPRSLHHLATLITQIPPLRRQPVASWNIFSPNLELKFWRSRRARNEMNGAIRQRFSDTFYSFYLYLNLQYGLHSTLFKRLFFTVSPWYAHRQHASRSAYQPQEHYAYKHWSVLRKEVISGKYSTKVNTVHMLYTYASSVVVRTIRKWTIKKGVSVNCSNWFEGLMRP